MRLAYLFQFNAQDPTELALRHSIRESGTDVHFYDFAEAKSGPRGRLKDEYSSTEFKEFIERVNPTHVFCWVPYLTHDELRWLQKKKIRVSAAINGITSFTSGIIPNQAKYFAYLQELDQYFVAHAPHIPVLRERGINAIEFPFCYDAGVFRRIGKWPRPGSLLSFDSTYIGNFGPAENEQGIYRAKVVRTAAEVGSTLMVCDRRYREHKIEGKSLWRLPTITSHQLLNLILNRSRISLGTDSFPNIEDYHRKNYDDVTVKYSLERDGFVMRPRTFWSMGAGAPFFVERYAEIQRFFEDGKEIVLWDSFNDLKEKIEFYLKHPEQLMKISEQGQKKALLLHSADVRVRQLLGILEK